VARDVDFCLLLNRQGPLPLARKEKAFVLAHIETCWVAPFPTAKKREDPSEKREDLFEKREDPFEKREDPSEKREDLFEKREDPFEKREDPSEKREDLFEKREDPSEKREDPFEKREDPSEKREDLFVSVPLATRGAAIHPTSSPHKPESLRCGIYCLLELVRCG
jgi:hypothetical protein